MVAGQAIWSYGQAELLTAVENVASAAASPRQKGAQVAGLRGGCGSVDRCAAGCRCHLPRCPPAPVDWPYTACKPA